VVEREREVAVDLECGHAADELRQPLVRDAIARLFDTLLERLVRDHPLDEIAPKNPAHVVGELDPIKLRVLILLLLQRTLELQQGDLLAVDLRGEARAHEREVDAPEDERYREQAEDDAGHPASDGVMNLLQHVGSLTKFG